MLIFLHVINYIIIELTMHSTIQWASSIATIIILSVQILETSIPLQLADNIAFRLP